jgi:hypothetical protein
VGRCLQRKLRGKTAYAPTRVTRSLSLPPRRASLFPFDSAMLSTRHSERRFVFCQSIPSTCSFLRCYARGRTNLLRAQLLLETCKQSSPRRVQASGYVLRLKHTGVRHGMGWVLAICVLETTAFSVLPRVSLLVHVTVVRRGTRIDAHFGKWLLSTA